MSYVFFSDPREQPTLESPIEQSVTAGLEVIKSRIKEKKKLHDIIIQNSFSIGWDVILNEVKKESIKDLKYTALWKSGYESHNPDSIILPKTQKLQVRVIGPDNDPKKNIADCLLALALYNSDLYLAQKYECQNISPFYPVGDLLDLKTKRLLKVSDRHDNLWALLEVNGIPDLSAIDFSCQTTFNDFLKIATKKNADDFRDWFHQNHELNEKEILKEYIAILNQVPYINRLPLKAFRFVVTTGFGLLPGISQMVSMFDAFVVEKLFRGKSPKFFIDDLTQIKGSIELQQGQFSRRKKPRG